MEKKPKYGSGYTCNVCGKYNRTSTLCQHDKLISDNMKQLLTAEEFAKNNHCMKTYPIDWKVMIEFAKLHVQAALESAAEKVRIEDDEYIEDGHYTKIVDKQSILNAYPLDNIK